MARKFTAEDGARAKAAQRDWRYIRQFPGIIDKKTGRPIEYPIPRSMALYILDGSDKAHRLDESDRDHPCVSYTGQSRVWREAKAATAIPARAACV